MGVLLKVNLFQSILLVRIIIVNNQLDTPQSTYFHALSSYLQHPEILHDDYKKRM